MRRTFARRSNNARPSRTWVDVSGAWDISAASTTATTLMSMQAPTSLVAITSDPPEDMTLLRIRGTFNVTFSAAAVAVQWTMALIVQDVTWTPSSTVAADNDKRMLWTSDYATSATNVIWQYFPPGIVLDGASNITAMAGICQVDISPKVKLEAGKGLFLVAYEGVDGRSFTTDSVNMRVLFQRSRRR